MNRRELLKSVAAGTTTLFVVPVLFNSCEDESPDPDDNNNPNELTIDLTESKYSALGTTGGSVFSTTGSVLNGPADSPLKKYEIVQEGDILTITL